jgi:hypothetical protein
MILCVFPSLVCIYTDDIKYADDSYGIATLNQAGRNRRHEFRRTSACHFPAIARR